jgi:predicted N-acetyltransferase YhbS
MEIRPARRSERDEVLDLLSLWYNDRDFFARYNQNDSTFCDELCLVAHDGGRTVSIVQIFDRVINLAGQVVPMGGIGSVFTLEEYRHKRIASELMRLSIDTMVRHGFELSLLFAERLTFYNQFGWREVPRNFSILGAAASIAATGNFVIDVFEEARDLADVAEIHRNYSGRFNVTAVRDNSAWRANLRFAGNQPNHPGEASDEYFVLCRGHADRIAAYARITRFHGVAMIMEFGYCAGDSEAMLSIFKHLGEAAAGAQLSLPQRGDHGRAALLRSASAAAAPGILVTHTAHDPELEQRLAGAGCPVVHHADDNYMWRMLTPDKLARRFQTTPDQAPAHMFAMIADPASLYWTADRF